MKKVQTLRHTDLKRILKGKFLKILMRNPILKVLRVVAEMIIKLMMQVIKNVYIIQNLVNKCFFYNNIMVYHYGTQCK